jgi:hypothetical protein
VALAQVTPGPPVHSAGHHVPTASRQARQPACIPQADRAGQALRTVATQDQASQTPRLALAASSGTPVAQVPPRWAGLTRARLGRDGRLVADTAWDGGPLLQARHAH